MVAMADAKLFLNLKQTYRKVFNLSEDEINCESFIKFPLFFFRLVLIDFEVLSDDASFKMKFKFYARQFLSWFILLSCIVGVLQFMAFGVVNSDNFNVVVRAISDTSTQALLIIKGSFIMLNKDKIRSIFEEIKTLINCRENRNEDQIMKKYLDGYYQFTKVNAIMIIIGYSVVTVPLTYFLITGKEVVVLKFWFPFETNHRFAITQMWTCFAVCLAMSLFLAADSLLSSLVTIISMEVDFLTTNFKHLKEMSKSERETKMAYFVNRHNELHEAIDKLKIIFEPSFLYNFILCSLILCIVCFDILTTANDPVLYAFDVIYIAIIAGHIWQLCYFGQKLTNSTDAVPERIYECDWTDLDDNKFKKQFIIIMARAQRSERLTAMGFADISLKTFAAVIYIFKYLKLNY